MKGGLGNIMKQAQAMQEKMQKAQEELAHMEVEGRLNRRRRKKCQE